MIKHSLREDILKPFKTFGKHFDVGTGSLEIERCLGLHNSQVCLGKLPRKVGFGKVFLGLFAEPAINYVEGGMLEKVSYMEGRHVIAPFI